LGLLKPQPFLLNSPVQGINNHSILPILPLNSKNINVPQTVFTKKEKEEEKVKEEPKKKKEKREEKVEEKKEEKKKKDSQTTYKIPKKKEKPEFERKLDSLLDESGGVGTEKDVSPFIQLMDDEKANHIYLLQSLTRTKHSIQKRFISLNGLFKLNNWLLDSSKMNILKDIIELLLVIPVTIDQLKSSGIGKTINKLKRDKFDDPSNVKSIKFF